ncbi:MAG: hypothetical protein AAFU67_00350 [Bacteroidota bacterium]
MGAPLIHLNYWYACNYAGIKSLQIILPSDVSRLPEALAVPNLEGDVVLNAGAIAYNIEFDPHTSRFREQLRSTDRNGDYYTREVSFNIRRLRIEVADLRRRLRNRKVHLLFTDNNDQVHLYTFMRLREADADGQRRGGRNQTEFVFRGASDTVAPMMNGGLVDDPTGGNEPVIINGLDGNTYNLVIGPCGNIIVIQTEGSEPGIDVVIGNWTIVVGDNSLVTQNNN